MELLVVDTAAAAEALLFSRYAAVVSSLWAWFAATAAVVGLWRFTSLAVSKPAVVVAIATGRALPPSTKPEPSAGPVVNPGMAKPDVVAVAAAAPRTEALALLPAPPAADRFGLEDDCFSTPKGRFTLYFQVDAGQRVAAGHDEDVAYEGKSLGEAFDWQEEVVMTTEVRSRSTGDLGWYRYQDRSTLNGSVVRLWNGDLRFEGDAGGSDRTVASWKISSIRGKLGMHF